MHFRALSLPPLALSTALLVVACTPTPNNALPITSAGFSQPVPAPVNPDIAQKNMRSELIASIQKIISTIPDTAPITNLTCNTGSSMEITMGDGKWLRVGDAKQRGAKDTRRFLTKLSDKKGSRSIEAGVEEIKGRWFNFTGKKLADDVKKAMISVAKRLVAKFSLSPDKPIADDNCVVRTPRPLTLTH